ncbi:MAG: zinc-dependent metalloprotease [Bacteroidales bacterium]|nr:zinc-dependent metalloprotease [Bacteroidales bacterium]
MMKSNSTLNFTPYDDGNGNCGFTAYDYSEILIYYANNMLSHNTSMHLPIGNNTPVLDRKYRLHLQGIYFHYDDNAYAFNQNTSGYLSNDEIEYYSVNPTEEINVFFVYEENGCVGGGNANMYGNRYVRIKAAWQKYINGGGNDGFWGDAWALVHETGHNLGLHHTMHKPQGPCCSINDYCDDGCTDTPTINEILALGQPDPCPHWGQNIPTKSNNIMDYSGEQAVTPEQLGIIHYSIMHNMFSYIFDDYCTINQNELEYVLENGRILTWQNDRILKNNLVIEDGAQLTIKDCKLHVPNGASIIVKPGGRLIVDGATITNRCDIMWQGIEVWGDCNAHQYEMHDCYSQGYLELKKGAVIENAKCAVELWRPGYYSTTGGILHASDATFLNNTMAVRALCFRNYHPYTNEETSYNAYFDNCEFIVNDKYLGTNVFEKHVVLVEVKGIDFSGCDFSADRSVDSVHRWCMGISSYDASFSVTSPCTTTALPCPDEDRDHSTFTGFCSGVYASGSGSNPHTFLVRGAIFDNNDLGINVLNTNYPTILFNDFRIGGGGYCDYNYGICLRNVTGFCIEENYFHSSSNPTGTTVGTAIYDSNGINDVYSNTFEDLSRANLAIGQNTSNSALQGLTYTCNGFDGNERDIMVLKGDIQSQQGSSVSPAGNTFENSVFQIYNDGSRQIDYYFRKNGINQKPTPSLLYHVILDSTFSVNACASHYEYNSVIKSSSEKDDLASDYLFAYNAYSVLRQLYESQIDDSDSDGYGADNNGATSDVVSQLGAQMAQYGHEFTLAAGDIVRSNLNDSIANPSELRAWLRNMNDIAADRMAVSSFMQEGDSANAFALANMLPNLYGLQGEQLSDHNDYLRLIQLYQKLKRTNRNAFQLTEDETSMVYRIAEDGTGVSQSMARVLKEKITGRGDNDVCLNPEMPDLGDGGKVGTTFSNSFEGNASSLNVSVSPNPATTWTTVNYSLPDNGSKALLTLTNSLGVNVFSMELDGVQGNKVIDLRNLSAGVYIYTIRFEHYTETGKLIITN